MLILDSLERQHSLRHYFRWHQSLRQLPNMGGSVPYSGNTLAGAAFFSAAALLSAALPPCDGTTPYGGITPCVDTILVCDINAMSCAIPSGWAFGGKRFLQRQAILLAAKLPLAINITGGIIHS